MRCRTEKKEMFTGQALAHLVLPTPKSWTWMRNGLGLFFTVMFVQIASAQVTLADDPGLPDLPPPSTAKTSDAADDKATEVKEDTDADPALEADVRPRLNEASGDNGQPARVDVDPSQRGKLGVQVAERNGQVSIHSVMSGGAAAHAGLEARDEVISVNGKRITTANQFRRQLRAAADDSGTATIVVSRDNDIQTIEADVSGRFTADTSDDRVQTYYRGPVSYYPNYYDGAYPYYLTFYPNYYGYPYYYGYGYYAPSWYYYPYCW